MKKADKPKRGFVRFIGGFLIANMTAWKLPSYAEERQQVTREEDLPTIDVVKDKLSETVYVLLNGDGTVKSVHVVNTFPVDGPGRYRDYGVYSQVVNLSNSAMAQVRNGAVTWNWRETSIDFIMRERPPSRENCLLHYAVPQS